MTLSQKWFKIVTITLMLSLDLLVVKAIVVTVPQDTYEFARGDNITLPCSFTTIKSPFAVIVTWSVDASEDRELTILTYHSFPSTLDVKKAYEGRAGLDHDISKGRVNLKLNNIMLSDNKMFKCKVQVLGDDEGKVYDRVRLLILVAPSPPLCKIKGTVEYGQNINLTCVSEEGSPTPTYKWDGHNVRNTLRQFPPTSKQKDGVLSLFKISMDTSGYYICTAGNKIRQATCNITVSVTPIQVTVPQDTYEVARGDNVTLPCSFTTRQSNPAAIVTWSVDTSENNELTILTYYSFSKQLDVKSAYEGRVDLDHDISKGRVNLKLNNIRLTDNKMFECKVQVPGDDEGKLSDSVRLLVLVAPSPPICAIQGKAEYGQNINLTCKSEEGSPIPTYKWDGHDVRNTLRQLPPTSKQKDGVLSLFNVSMETSGYYICTAANKIRQATCNITVSVLPPSMNIGSTAGIIGGACAALLILIIIIYCCCCRKKKGEEEYEMGQQEDYHDAESTKEREPRDRIERMSERSNDADGRSDYSRRDDRYDDRSDRYDDRRDDRYDDRRDDRYDDRRDDRYDDRRDDRYDDRDRDRYNDRRDRYDDDDDRRNNSYERERPPSVPANKPSRDDYD